MSEVEKIEKELAQLKSGLGIKQQLPNGQVRGMIFHSELAQDFALAALARIAMLLEYVKVTEYGFKVRGEWNCAHKHPGPDELCARCQIDQARAQLGLTRRL